MDKTRLTILRGKLLAAESGFSAGLYRASDIRALVAEWESIYRDMPAEERARVDVLKKAAEGSDERGLPS